MLKQEPSMQTEEEWNPDQITEHQHEAETLSSYVQRRQNGLLERNMIIYIKLCDWIIIKPWYTAPRFTASMHSIASSFQQITDVHTLTS